MRGSWEPAYRYGSIIRVLKYCRALSCTARHAPAPGLIAYVTKGRQCTQRVCVGSPEVSKFEGAQQICVGYYYSELVSCLDDKKGVVKVSVESERLHVL